MMATSVLSGACPAPAPAAPGDGLLPPELSETARLQLREDPALREHALRQMRHFIEKHPAIIQCRTDAPFLLRFLRTKKFSIPQACAMLEKYLAIRQAHPHWFQRLDPLDPALAAVVRAGYLLPLPTRDQHGRQIILSSIGRFDPHAHDSSTMARVHGMVAELLMDSPLSQLHGYTYVIDEEGLTMPHVSLWSLKDIRTMLHCIQNSTPMRHKTTHFVNMPAYGARVVEFSMSVLSDKLRERLQVHRSVEELTRAVPRSLLPERYGGPLRAAQLVAALESELLAARPRLLALDDMRVDLSLLARADLQLEAAGAGGSFRKLDFD